MYVCKDTFKVRLLENNTNNESINETQLETIMRMYVINN